MADKEYSVIEILDILRRYAAGDRIRAIACHRRPMVDPLSAGKRTHLSVFE